MNAGTSHPAKRVPAVMQGGIVAHDGMLCRVVAADGDALILRPVVAQHSILDPVATHVENVQVITRGGGERKIGWFHGLESLVAVDTHADGSFTAHHITDVMLGDGGLMFTLRPAWHNRYGVLEGDDARDFDCDAHRVTLIDGRGRRLEPDTYTADSNDGTEPKAVA